MSFARPFAHASAAATGALLWLAACTTAPTGTWSAGPTPTLPQGEVVDLGGGASRRYVADTALGAHVHTALSLPAPPADSAEAFKAGPAVHGNRYGENRRFWPIQRSTEPGVVWQSPSAGGVYVTWLGAELQQARTLSVPTETDEVLAGATADAAGRIFVLLVAAGTDVKLGTRPTRLLRVRADGADGEAAVVEQATAQKPEKAGLNINVFGTTKQSTNQVAMATGTASDGKPIVGAIVARKMHAAADGLNHQGAVTVIWDAETLEPRGKIAQSSSHSFECFATTGSEGALLGVDLGDNYPRGVHLHRWDETGRSSRVVYTFKTAHGTSAKNPAGKTFPAYETESAKQLYQWSNDNSTYTELGGVVETSAGLLVIFAGENDALDNAKATGLHNAPRNLGAVLVRRDFGEASKGAGPNVVTDDLVLPGGGAAEEGGFYTFGGKWTEQRNVGVRWLTNYVDLASDNASRVKVLGLPDGRVAVLWERWTGKAYQDSWAMVLQADGTPQKGPLPLGTALRLGRRTDPFLWNGRLVVVGGDAAGQQLLVDAFWAP